MPDTQRILGKLEERRRDLRMSCKALARRSGLSMTTVQRTLRTQDGGATLSTVAALAEALGLKLGLPQQRSVAAIRREQARKKAHRIVALAQGSAALEGQGVDPATRNHVEDEMTARFIAGPAVRLWET